MTYRFRGIALLALATWIAGCATVASGPDFAEARARSQPANKATVYIYRKYAEPTAWGANIHIGDRELATLNQGGFTWAYLAPGSQEVRAVWAGLSGQRDSKISINIEAGRTYFVELVGVTRMTGVGVGVTYWKIGSGLNEINPAVAELVVAQCCKFQKPVSIEP